VERAVVRVITPGTLSDEALLNERADSLLMAITGNAKNRFGLAWIDISSGRFSLCEIDSVDGMLAEVEHHLGELFPRVGFIVTNRTLPSSSVVRFYNKRGTAEQWIKEGKQATNWTRLSCHRFRANEVRLQLSVLAYNLGNLWRRLGLPRRIKSWSLTSLQHRLMKTGGRLVKHARYYWLLLAEGHLNRKLFGQMLGRLAALPVPGG
jgi:hypothetical protein